MSTETGFQPLPVNVRIRISALWTTMLFVFAYVDIFGFYRPDVRADIEAGRISAFDIDQAFLLMTTVYVAIPSLMVVGALVLRPRANRFINVALSVIYALTIIAGSMDQWSYYLVGSAIEVALLLAVAYYAWTWPKAAPAAAADETTVPAARMRAAQEGS